MRTQRDRISRVRERLHTATQNIDDSINLDLQEYGDRILTGVRREVLGILSEAYDGDKHALLFAEGSIFNVDTHHHTAARVLSDASVF